MMASRTRGVNSASGMPSTLAAEATASRLATLAAAFDPAGIGGLGHRAGGRVRGCCVRLSSRSASCSALANLGLLPVLNNAFIDPQRMVNDG